ncbi:MAG TPA: phosphopantetheine-binding protein [Bryobacteraceae bacterium]|nr:phosphopantetheine-binding protein [Bryobacteraceae bacterium]
MSDELNQRIIRVIADTQHIPPETVTLDSTFAELNIDSLDGINILFALESEFNISIPDDAANTIRSVRDVVQGVTALLEGGTNVASSEAASAG